MIAVCIVPYSDIRDHPDLLAEYAVECSVPALGKIDPQWDTYAALEWAGAMRVYAVFDDFDVVGFSAVLHHVLPHYGALVGIVESLFVGKEHRTSGAGRILMAEIEADARRLGCKAIIYSAPPGSQLEAVLETRYPRAGATYCKPLG